MLPVRSASAPRYYGYGDGLGLSTSVHWCMAHDSVGVARTTSTRRPYYAGDILPRRELLTREPPPPSAIDAFGTDLLVRS